MKNILQTKVLNLVTLDRLLGTLVMYFLVVGIAMTVQYFGEIKAETEQRAVELEKKELLLQEIARPASDYIEYISIQPTQAAFDRFEDIQMTSHTIRKRGALVQWNDILYCDANGDGTFAYIYNSENSIYHATPAEPLESKTNWYFVEPFRSLPRVPEASCYILSQQKVCPPELAEVDGAACKQQEVISSKFNLLNRDQ